MRAPLRVVKHPMRQEISAVPQGRFLCWLPGDVCWLSFQFDTSRELSTTFRANMAASEIISWRLVRTERAMTANIRPRLQRSAVGQALVCLHMSGLGQAAALSGQ